MGLKKLIVDFQMNSIKRPFLIAEAGVNHEGSMEVAKRLIDEAKEGGADAIKFQSYKADTLVSKNSPAYWDISKEPISSQHELFKKYDKFWKSEFEMLKKFCDKTEIEFLSTPFDLESACFLNELMNVFKVSSSDITNKPFIQYICEFGKPILLSTGASNVDEIHDAVEWIESKRNPLALLHCILNYPTESQNANLAMIQDLKKKFPQCPIGYSDHTLPDDMKKLEVAVLLGATIVEKHFTHDKSLVGNDHYHAMDKEDLRTLCLNLDSLFELLGEENKRSIPSEEIARLNARRSLVALRDIPEGKRIQSEDITWKRPASGISPKEINRVINSKTLRDISEDTILQWSDFID